MRTCENVEAEKPANWWIDAVTRIKKQKRTGRLIDHIIGKNS